MGVMIESLERICGAFASGRDARTVRDGGANAVRAVPCPARARNRIVAWFLDTVAGKAVGATLPFWIVLFPAPWLSTVAHAQSESAVSVAEPADFGVNAGYTYDDNVTRAPSGPDKLFDQFYRFDAGRRFEFPVDDRTQVVVDAIVGGEWAGRYTGLGSYFGEIQGEIQYRGSARFDEPTLALFGRAFARRFRSDLRSGFHYAAGVSVFQPVTDRINLFGALTHDRRYARSDVFDTRENSILLNVDYLNEPHGTFYLAGEYRRGTVVSTGRPTLQIIDIAELFIEDDVFSSRQMIDYRLQARTVLTTLGYNLPVDADASLDFSWRRVQSTSLQSASFPGGEALRYVANQFAIVYLVRF